MDFLLIAKLFLWIAEKDFIVDFQQIGTHHTAEDFAVRGKEPKDDYE